MRGLHLWDLFNGRSHCEEREPHDLISWEREAVGSLIVGRYGGVRIVIQPNRYLSSGKATREKVG